MDESKRETLHCVSVRLPSYQDNRAINQTLLSTILKTKMAANPCISVRLVCFTSEQASDHEAVVNRLQTMSDAGTSPWPLVNDLTKAAKPVDAQDSGPVFFPRTSPRKACYRVVHPEAMPSLDGCGFHCMMPGGLRRYGECICKLFKLLFQRDSCFNCVLCVHQVGTHCRVA